jgi:BirA family biotin operon repressor/biotin-[acetyl-CoA-carboxylase] ligase
MATPYFQLRFDSVPSTQDRAAEELDDVPVVVIAAGQTAGRGRAGSEWITADRALAVSLALRWDLHDSRPLSLMAGVAAARAVSQIRLKWPNDLLLDDDKVGGILVELRDGCAMVGLGLNLWWPEAPEGMTALYSEDPGPDLHAELGALWAAELMRLIDGEGWPIDEYRSLCDTLGREVTWEPSGSGRAVDVARDGALLVEVDDEARSIYSGEVRHLRG